MDSRRFSGPRNRLATALANFALRHIATKDYQRTLYGVIRVGMRTLDDEQASPSHSTRSPFGV